MIQKTILLSFVLLLPLIGAESKNLTMQQKKSLDGSLRIFSMAEKRPELWSAILQDLKVYKGTKGSDSIVKFFEGRVKNDLDSYIKKFADASVKLQEKVFKENEKEIKDNIAEAKKVFANVNYDTTKVSWSHMSSVKSTILFSASKVLEANPDLDLLRKQVDGLMDIISEFQDGEAADLKTQEGFILSRSITFADKNSQKIMANNELADIPMDIKIGIRDLNVMRLIFGKNALATDKKLCDCSTDHSKDMDEKNFFAHESIVPGKKSPWDRARNFGTTAGGENIAKGMNSSLKANRGWYLSPGHFKNMFSNKNRVGLGSHGKLWTQMLGN